MRFRGSTAGFYVFLLGLMVPQEALVVPLYFDQGNGTRYRSLGCGPCQMLPSTLPK